MNPSTLFFYFAEDQICFAVESRSSGLTKDKGKKLYHLNSDDESVRKLLRYIKYKFWTEKISEKNTPKIMEIRDPLFTTRPHFKLEYEGYKVDFTPDKFTGQQEEKEMKVVTAEDISRIFTEMEEKYGKDKAIGILVGKTQESVRPIDGKSAAQILFEKLQEHQNKEKETKKLTVEYQGYKLEVTIHYNYHSAKGNPYIIGTCDELDSFVKSGYYENCSPIIEEYMKYVDHVIENKKKKESSTITLNYYYFSSKVYWDNTHCWWYVSHIFDKADKDILKEDAITGKHIQELQAKFEEYIDKYLVERKK